MNTRSPTTPRPTVNLSIDVPALEEGLRFYREVFGFVETARPFPSMAIVDANNVTICIHQKAAGTKSSPVGVSERDYARHWTPVHLDLHVHDFDAVLEKVVAGGGAVELQFRNQGPRPVAMCSDPFGNGFCVIADRLEGR